MKQIIAMGGGGFSMEPENLALDRYILAQVEKPRPKMCFIPTASAESENYILRFYKASAELDCIPSSLSLFWPPKDLREFVFEKDILYVGGGNTRNLVALWREWGLDRIIFDAYEAGILLAGISAGANCWFEECSTDSSGHGLGMLPALGFLPGSFSPHYDGEPERRPWLHKTLLSGGILPCLAADDGAAVHFLNGEIKQAVCSRPEAKAYHVFVQDGQVSELPLEMEYLTHQAR